MIKALTLGLIMGAVIRMIFWGNAYGGAYGRKGDKNE